MQCRKNVYVELIAHFEFVYTATLKNLEIITQCAKNLQEKYSQNIEDTIINQFLYLKALFMSCESEVDENCPYCNYTLCFEIYLPKH